MEDAIASDACQSQLVKQQQQQTLAFAQFAEDLVSN
jgi:hypothetical protein